MQLMKERELLIRSVVNLILAVGALLAGAFVRETVATGMYSAWWVSGAAEVRYGNFGAAMKFEVIAKTRLVSHHNLMSWKTPPFGRFHLRNT